MLCNVDSGSRLQGDSGQSSRRRQIGGGIRAGIQISAVQLGTLRQKYSRFDRTLCPVSDRTIPPGCRAGIQMVSINQFGCVSGATTAHACPSGWLRGFSTMQAWKPPAQLLEGERSGTDALCLDFQAYLMNCQYLHS